MIKTRPRTMRMIGQTICQLNAGTKRWSRPSAPNPIKIKPTIRLPLLAGMCGFGGMCVIAQSLGALKGCGIGAGTYVGIRALAGVIEACCMALLLKLPQLKAEYLIEPIREKPLAAAMLITAILACPVLVKLNRSIS